MTFASRWYIASRFHLRVFVFLFLFHKRESRAIIFDLPCLGDKAAGGRFSQAEGEVYRSLCADNDDRTAVTATLSVGSRRSRIPLGERTT